MFALNLPGEWLSMEEWEGKGGGGAANSLAAACGTIYHLPLICETHTSFFPLLNVRRTKPWELGALSHRFNSSKRGPAGSN